MADLQMENQHEPGMSSEEVRGWIEFSAWSALVMTPIIWWLQGPSVSTDQFVMRTALVVISFSVATGMRIFAILQSRRKG